jgi:CarD family transcriptional regulator
MEGRIDVFEPGEKVMYPQFGLGTVAGVTEKQVNGSAQCFYRLEFPIKQMEILVPVDRARENGLRRVMSRKEVKDLVKHVTSGIHSAKSQQWHRWRKKTLEQLKSGDPLEIANIYRYLRSLEGKKGLSFTERKILTQVERMLISEIAVALQVSEEHAERMIAPAKLVAAGKLLASGNGKARELAS